MTDNDANNFSRLQKMSHLLTFSLKCLGWDISSSSLTNTYASNWVKFALFEL